MRYSPPRRLLLVLPLVFGALLAVGAVIGPSSSTETRYCVMAREMLRSGDWIVPRFNGAPLLEKPPFEYWGTAAAMAVAGVNDLAPRLPHLLAGVLTVLLVGRIARRLSPQPSEARDRGRLALLALATMPAFLVQTYAVAPDAWLLLVTTAAGWAVVEADRIEGKVPRRWVALLSLALGLGMLIKGPLSLGLVLGASLVTAALRRDARILRPFARPLGWLLFLAVTLPWYLALDRALPGTLKALVDRRLFGGLSSAADFHSRPVYTVWGPMMGAFPWLGVLPAALAVLVRDGRFRKGPGLPLALFALSAPLLFTFSASRLPSYGSPAYPFVAILVAIGAPGAGVEDAPRGWRAFGQGLVHGSRGYAVAAAGVVVAASVLAGAPAWAVLGAGLVALTSLALTFLPHGARLVPSVVARAALSTTGFVLAGCVLACALPARVGVAVGLGHILRERRAVGEPYGVLLNYNGDWGAVPWAMKEEVLFFDYPSEPMIVPPEAYRPDLFRSREAMRRWLDEPGRRWLFLRPRDRRRLASEGVRLTVAAAAHEYELVHTE